MDFNSSSSYEDYTFVYDDDDVLIPMCEVDDYSKTTGVCYAMIFCLSILGNGFRVCTHLLRRPEKVHQPFHVLFGSFWPSVHTDIAFLVRGASSLGFWWRCLQDHDRGLFCRHLRKPHPSHGHDPRPFCVVVIRSNWLTRSRRLKCSKAACVGAWIISLIACLRDSIAASHKTCISTHTHVKAPIQLMTTLDITLSSFCCSLYRLPSLFSVTPKSFWPSCQHRPGRNTRLWFWCCALLSLLHMLGAVSYHHRVDVHLWLWCLWTLSAACCVYRLQDSGVFSLLHKLSIVYCQREVQKSLVKLIVLLAWTQAAGALQRSNGSQRLQDSSVHQWELEKLLKCNKQTSQRWTSWKHCKNGDQKQENIIYSTILVMERSVWFYLKKYVSLLNTSFYITNLEP